MHNHAPGAYACGRSHTRLSNPRALDKTAWPGSDRCAKCRWGLGWGVLRKTRSVLKMEDARLYSNTHYQGVEETVCVCG